jgi:uncharacterized membrane protein YczE
LLSNSSSSSSSSFFQFPGVLMGARQTMISAGHYHIRFTTLLAGIRHRGMCWSGDCHLWKDLIWGFSPSSSLAMTAWESFLSSCCVDCTWHLFRTRQQHCWFSASIFINAWVWFSRRSV